MELSFKSIKKGHLVITLEDGRKLTLNSPKLKTIKKWDAKGKNEDLDTTLEIISEALSSNREGITITPEDVESIFDMADLHLFMNKYGEFVEGAVNQKN